jgi:hypothetical protein
VVGILIDFADFRERLLVDHLVKSQDRLWVSDRLRLVNRMGQTLDFILVAVCIVCFVHLFTHLFHPELLNDSLVDYGSSFL